MADKQQAPTTGEYDNPALYRDAGDGSHERVVAIHLEYWNPDTLEWEKWTGAGGVGMAVHGNEYHDPDFEEVGVAAAADAAHVAAADPHTGYQKESEKNAANGYAGLTAGSKLNLTQMQEVMAYADLTDDPIPGAIATHAAIVAAHHARYTDAEAVIAAKTVKLDDFTAPDDNTDLDASTTKHGLLPKLSNVATQYLNGLGGWSVPAGGGGGGTAIWDADADTGIQTEEAADEDIIRFDIAGVGDVMTLQAGGLLLKAHSALGADAALGAGRVVVIEEASIVSGGLTAYGLKMDVGYAGGDVGNALYGFYLYSRNKVVAPGSLSVLYGLAFIASHESPQALTTAYGVKGQIVSSAAGTGAWTTAYGVVATGSYAGSKPGTAIGMRLFAALAPAGVTTAYGYWCDDLAATTSYLLNLGPGTPYLRVIGGAAPGANLTNVYINESGTLRQIQIVTSDAGGHVAAGSKVLVAV